MEGLSHSSWWLFSFDLLVTSVTMVMKITKLFMVTFPIKLTNDQHINLRLISARAGKSMSGFILDRIFGDKDDKDFLSRVMESNKRPTDQPVIQKVEPPKEAKELWKCILCDEILNAATRSNHITTCKPKEAKECEHVWDFIENGERAKCTECDFIRKTIKPKEPTVVSKEEEDEEIQRLDKVIKIVEKRRKPKETKHRPNCTCFTCKPPKTK